MPSKTKSTKSKSTAGAKPNPWMTFLKAWRKQNPHVKDPIEQAKKASVAYRARR